MAAYQGHRSWNAWNVSLWISNEEPLYHLALECLDSKDRNGRKRNLTGAARAFTRLVGAEKTPDGAKYNVTCVKEALAGLQE